VQAAVGLDDGVDRCLDRRAVGDVQAQAAATLRRQRLGDGGGAGLGGGGADDGEALGGQRLGWRGRCRARRR